MGGGSSPPPIDQYAATVGDIRARVDTAPEVFAAEQRYTPQADALSLQSMHDVLMGMPASSRQQNYTENVPGFRNNQTGEFVAGTTAPSWSAPLSGGRGGSATPQTNPWSPYTQQVQRTTTIDTPGQMGYLDLARQVAATGDDIQAQSQTRQRTADIQDVGNLGPEALKAIMSSDPAQAREINALTNQTTDDLQNGYNLSPAQMRLAQQAARSGQAARGMGYGPADNYGEALGVSQFGQSLYQNRLQNATNAVGTRAATYGNSFQQVLNRPVGQAGQPYLGAGYGISQNAIAGMPNFNSSVNGSDVVGANYNAANARSIAANNNNAALTSAGISAGVGITSAALLASI